MIGHPPSLAECDWHRPYSIHSDHPLALARKAVFNAAGVVARAFHEEESDTQRDARQLLVSGLIESADELEKQLAKLEIAEVGR